MSAEFSGHHVQGTVGHRGDGVAALTNTACFAEDHIESNRLGHFDGSVEVGTDFRTRATAGKTAHVEIIVGERIHTDAITEQRSTGSLTGWVNTKQTDFLSWIVALDAQHQFIEQT